MAEGLTGDALATGRRSLRSAMQAVADALTAHGFAAHAEGRNDQLRIINNHCPFGEVATDHPVICAVDRGMVKGMLGAGSSVPRTVMPSATWSPSRASPAATRSARPPSDGAVECSRRTAVVERPRSRASGDSFIVGDDDPSCDNAAAAPMLVVFAACGGSDDGSADSVGHPAGDRCRWARRRPNRHPRYPLSPPIRPFPPIRPGSPMPPVTARSVPGRSTARGWNRSMPLRHRPTSPSRRRVGS